MENIIKPKILKGFRDFLPDAEIKRTFLIEQITNVYRSFGFVPIDTPVLEYTEILLRKSSGETEKQVFSFKDNGGRDVSMRFDLTVPFARFTAEHKSELYFPFKRYHAAKVWRGEKPQTGRYREFIQCDVDTVGSDSAYSDFEILTAVREALIACGADNILIRVNHIGIFNSFLSEIRCSEFKTDIMRSVDRLHKDGKEKVVSDLVKIIDDLQKVQQIIDFIDTKGSFLEVLEKLEQKAGDCKDCIIRMKEIYSLINSEGCTDFYVFDPAVMRGLDYYTGMVFETFLKDLPSIGSVCSGGRYDNLAGLYMKEKLPGVGASIGLDRLVASLENLGKLPNVKGYLDVEIFCTDSKNIVFYQKTASQLRRLGISSEVFPEPKKMVQQYACAEAKNIMWGIILSDEDIKKGSLTLKNLSSRQVFNLQDIQKAAEIINASKNKI